MVCTAPLAACRGRLLEECAARKWRAPHPAAAPSLVFKKPLATPAGIAPALQRRARAHGTVDSDSRVGAATRGQVRSRPVRD